MKNLTKITLIPLLLMTLTSCLTPTPVASYKPSNNKGYTVHYLFEHDGCKVYRFIDYGHGNTVYFTNCRGDVSSFSNDSTSTRTFNLPEPHFNDQ